MVVVPALLAARRAVRPVHRVLRAMQTSVACYSDGDFSVSLVVDRRDELGELLRTNNELGSALRKQRAHLVQRELLLDTVTQHSPVALVLVDPHQRVVYANIAARHLLNEGRIAAGWRFRADSGCGAGSRCRRPSPPAATACSPPGSPARRRPSACRSARFALQGQRHRMYLLKTLTRELSRQEVATWKKLIRVVSHELNNSLGPIASMADTGRELLRRGDTSTLVDVFAAIRERAAHLHQFVAGYSAISRLPAPRPDRVGWAELMEELARQQAFSVAGPLPQEPGWFDRLQLEQALINVLKNAHEAGGDPAQVSIRVQQTPQEQRIEVLDRGPGMTEVVLAQALLPFYSTKHDGTGLGLALCREIAEAHGGSLRLSNREGGGLSVMVVLPMPSCSGSGVSSLGHGQRYRRTPGIEAGLSWKRANAELSDVVYRQHKELESLREGLRALAEKLESASTPSRCAGPKTSGRRILSASRYCCEEIRRRPACSRESPRARAPAVRAGTPASPPLRARSSPASIEAAVAQGLVIDRRDADVFRKIAPAATSQLGNDGLETAARIKHIIDQQQPVFRSRRDTR